MSIKPPSGIHIIHRSGILPTSDETLNAADSPVYGEGIITNGYARASGVLVTVQKGTTANINVDFTVNSITIDSFNDWWTIANNYFNDEQRHKLHRILQDGGSLGEFLVNCFGIMFGGGDASKYKNQTDVPWGASNANQGDFCKSIYNLTQTRIRVTGSLHASGVSETPVQASIFVILTTIFFGDGNAITAIDTNNPVAARINGDTKGVVSAPSKLKIEPL